MRKVFVLCFQFLLVDYVYRTYNGMSSRHLSTRVKEHLNFSINQKSSIKDHINSCNICLETKFRLDSFKIIQKCRSEYDAKIHEALSIKKFLPNPVKT